jgi:hypothetical protein
MCRKSEAPEGWPAVIGLPKRPRQAIMTQCSESNIIMNITNMAYACPSNRHRQPERVSCDLFGQD